MFAAASERELKGDVSGGHDHVIFSTHGVGYRAHSAYNIDNHGRGGGVKWEGNPRREGEVPGSVCCQRQGKVRGKRQERWNHLFRSSTWQADTVTFRLGQVWGTSELWHWGLMGSWARRWISRAGYPVDVPRIPGTCPEVRLMTLQLEYAGTPEFDTFWLYRFDDRHLFGQNIPGMSHSIGRVYLCIMVKIQLNLIFIDY